MECWTKCWRGSNMVHSISMYSSELSDKDQNYCCDRLINGAQSSDGVHLTQHPEIFGSCLLRLIGRNTQMACMGRCARVWRHELRGAARRIWRHELRGAARGYEGMSFLCARECLRASGCVHGSLVLAFFYSYVFVDSWDARRFARMYGSYAAQIPEIISSYVLRFLSSLILEIFGFCILLFLCSSVLVFFYSWYDHRC